MEPVIISNNGIILNILSLNYTPLTMVQEYINNVISKNDDDNYKIIFSLKEKKSGQMSQFVFKEYNCVGFESLEQMKKAYSIANSERTGTNNMGYGIYSPISVYKNCDSFNLFIQNTESGRLYSISRFECETNNITTFQDTYTGTKIHGVDLTSIIPDNGTVSIWFSAPNIGEDIETQNAILKYIKKQNSKFEKEKNMNNEDIICDVNKIGKLYYNELQNKQIYYGENPIIPINLISDDNKEEYKLSILSNSDNKRNDYRIKSDESEEWMNFCDNSRKPIGEGTYRRFLRSDEQHAKIIITDPGIPDSARKSREAIYDKRIWVRLDGIFIFSEEFTMNGWPNIRAILDLTNECDNKVDKFISLNPNKSNSKINAEIKSRMTSLIRYVANNKFNKDSSRRRPTIPPQIKQEIWEGNFGNCCRHNCYVEECKNEITAWDFHAGHNIPYSEGGEDKIDNLRPICSKCNLSMGDQFTIDEWNLKLRSYH
jgi:5-methylcytosine-specific restriction endonuclease McrA